MIEPEQIYDFLKKALQDKKMVKDHIEATGSLKNLDERKLNGKLEKPL